MKLFCIADILTLDSPRSLTARGWVRSRRDAKSFSFLTLNDGSGVANLQVVVDETCEGGALRTEATTGSSVEVHGELVASPGKGQRWELKAQRLVLVGKAPEDYPLQKKGHSKEFLRDLSHLRPRTNLFGAVFRMRSRLSFAVHRFFQERGFFHVHTPILTGSDCEGAGELFEVQVPGQTEAFFGKKTFLTVSGQLEGETYASALSKIYTFGPTFRAENSHTSRHAAEFWMIEPEIAFCDLEELMSCAEDFLTFLLKDVLTNQSEDLAFLNEFVDRGLTARLEHLIAAPFARVEYREALEILQQSGVLFEHPCHWDSGLQTEHERYLCEEHFQKPTFVTHYPRTIKPFYMKQDPGGETVAAVDLLVPGIGELIGGSQREDCLDTLQQAMSEQGIDWQAYDWYLDLRKYGSVPHAGFGAGFERLIMLVTGMSNIRDVIAYPRTPGNCAP